VRPNLAPRAHQRVAAAPVEPDNDNDSNEILYEEEEDEDRRHAASPNAFNHLKVINRARPKLGDVLIVILELD
jgi:hypothetical protein